MKKIIQSLIKKSPTYSITYETLIKEVLYHETHGYYTKEKEKIGRKGDFYTSSMVHEIFAEMFARYFYDTAKQVSLPLTICEIGGGDGRFAKQVMDLITQSSFQDCPIHYHFIESSPDHRKKAESRLGDHTSFFTYSSVAEMISKAGTISGFVFTNEWLDAQPVRVVTKQDDSLVEVMITLNENEDLIETFRPCPKEIGNWMNEYSIAMKENNRLEIPLYMLECASQLDDLLDKGVILTVDYGYTNEELQHPSRSQGSLRGYYNHQLKENVLEYLGEMDITHHVHWDTWEKMGQKHNLQFVQLIKQNEFLLRAGILDQLMEHDVRDPFSMEQKKNRAIRSFVMGEGFADAFDICIQTKGIERDRLKIN